jgi:hypothetical protein
MNKPIRYHFAFIHDKSEFLIYTSHYFFTFTNSERFDYNRYTNSKTVELFIFINSEGFKSLAIDEDEQSYLPQTYTIQSDFGASKR